MVLEISHSHIVHVCIHRLYIGRSFAQIFTLTIWFALSTYLSYMGFARALTAAIRLVVASLLRCFQLDGGETLFLAEVPSNVKGGTRSVSFVSVFKFMVASYFQILESQLRARVDGRTDTRADESAGRRKSTSALTNGAGVRTCGRASDAAAHG